MSYLDVRGGKMKKNCLPPYPSTPQYPDVGIIFPLFSSSSWLLRHCSRWLLIAVLSSKKTKQNLSLTEQEWSPLIRWQKALPRNHSTERERTSRERFWKSVFLGKIVGHWELPKRMLMLITLKDTWVGTGWPPASRLSKGQKPDCINIPVTGQLLSGHRTAEISELGVLWTHKVEVFTSEKGGRNGFLLVPRLVRRLKELGSYYRRKLIRLNPYRIN